MANTTLNDILNDARRVSTPLVAISTPDPAALTASLINTLPPGVAVVQWDVINGVQARNEQGVEAAGKMVGDSDNTPNNPTGAAIKALNLPCEQRAVHAPGRPLVVRRTPAGTSSPWPAGTCGTSSRLTGARWCCWDTTWTGCRPS